MKKEKKEIDLQDEETVSLIAAQAIQEIAFAREHKENKTAGWKKNENLYYGCKEKTKSSRANIDLAQGQEFVHTILSKIDEPLVFKFVKRKSAQYQRVKLLNAVREYDSKRDNWSIKDIVGKKQACLYGRAIYFYHADQKGGKYTPNLEPVDVYNFLIDPAANGYDMETARYMGDYSVVLDKKQIKQGMDEGIYRKDVAQELLDGSGDNGEETDEEINKRNRELATDIGERSEKQLSRDIYRMWRWFTTYEGERCYLVINESGQCLRIEKLDEFIPPVGEAKPMFPYWSWSFFLDMTEFWSPSPMDYARELFMAQNVSINQMLDNAEAINKPQKAVDVKAVENLNDLKYRKGGIIRMKQGTNINNAIQMLQVPSINTPIKVYEILGAIQSRASGVTDSAKGVADENGKVGIYEGNKEAVADRFGLLNKSYSFGYERFAQLYCILLKENLTNKIAVEIIGPEGVEVKSVEKKDIYRSDDEEYTISVESSNAEKMASMQDKLTKINFLRMQAKNQIQNQKKSYEMQARISGFTDEEIKELLDVEAYGNTKILSECDRDLERLLDMDMIKANQSANLSYKQKMVDYLRDHEEDISPEQAKHIFTYIDSLEPVIMRNEASKMKKELADEQEQVSKAGLMQQLAGGQTQQPEEPQEQPLLSREDLTQ